MIQTRTQQKKVKEVTIQIMTQMKFMIQELILLGITGGHLNLSIQIMIVIKMKFYSFYRNLKKLKFSQIIIYINFPKI